MGAWGAIIMGFFGSFFAALTLSASRGWADVVVFTPFLLFAVIAIAAWAVLRRPGAGLAPSPREARIIAWSTVGEGVGLFVAANLVINLQRPELLLPAMALVVGLHFVPMGWLMPFRPFMLLAVALLAASGLGVAVAAPLGPLLSGFAAALALWSAAALALARDHRARAA